jgi:hypothetical protein
MAISDYYITRKAGVPDIELGGALEVTHMVDEHPIDSTPSTDFYGLGMLPPPEQHTWDGETHIREGQLQGERKGEVEPVHDG